MFLLSLQSYRLVTSHPRRCCNYYLVPMRHRIETRLRDLISQSQLVCRQIVANHAPRTTLWRMALLTNHHRLQTLLLNETFNFLVDFQRVVIVNSAYCTSNNCMYCRHGILFPLRQNADFPALNRCVAFLMHQCNHGPLSQEEVELFMPPPLPIAPPAEGYLE